MKCMAVDSLELLGDYDASTAKNLMVAFVKCDSKKRNDCKSEEIIDEWLTHKYIVRLENSKSFVPNKFGEDKIEKTSRLKWEPVSKNSRMERPQLMIRTKSIFKDSYFQINYGDISVEEETGFIA